MTERIVLRALLYFVFGWCLLALVSPNNPDDVKPTIAFAALLAIGLLAVSAYDPRVKTPRPPWGEAGAAGGKKDEGWLTRRD